MRAPADAIAALARLLCLALLLAQPAGARADGPPEAAPPASRGLADVTSVATRGAPGAYTFMVTVQSPDEGCERYASWWEVVTPDGVLVYRRILQHSHVEEQPFARPGGPVPVEPDADLMVRAYFHPSGYGGKVVVGTVASGFRPLEEAPPDFALDLAYAEPRPTGCRY